MIGILILILVIVLIVGTFRLTTGLLRAMLMAIVAVAPIVLVIMLVGAGSLAGTFGIIAIGGPGLALGAGIVLTAAGAVYIGTVPGMLGLVFGLVLMALGAAGMH